MPREKSSVRACKHTLASAAGDFGFTCQFANVDGPVDAMTLFPSRYNSFYPRAEGVVGYNARTGAFALLAMDVAEQLRTSEPIDQMRDADSLLAMGFVHEGNELDLVLSRYEGDRSPTYGVHVTLVPTMACNFHCDYCYQNEYRTHKAMSVETQESTLRFVRNLIRSGQRGLSVDWYGGEPLLEIDTVCAMTYRLSAIASEEGARVRRVNIITNGTLLTSDVAKRLADAGITESQVSFDSFIFQETTKRGAQNGAGGRSLILENILLAHSLFPVTIRINVSKDNKDEVGSIVDAIKESGFSGSYYMARIHDHEKDTGFITNSEGRRVSARSVLLPIIDNANVSTLTRREYADLEWEQLTSNPREINRIARRLTPKTHFCSATTLNGFVIDPDGNISRCWHSAGSASEAIGNVNSDVTVDDQNEVYRRWQGYTPLMYVACETCKVLPLCMGGCSHPRLFMDARHPPCESIRFQINKSIEAISSRLTLPSNGLG